LPVAPEHAGNMQHARIRRQQQPTNHILIAAIKAPKTKVKPLKK